MAIYLKVVLLTALPLSVLMCVMYGMGLMYGSELASAVLYLVIPGVILCVLMSAILGTMQLIGTKWAGAPNSKVQQQAKFTTSLTREQVLEACVEALKRVKRSRVDRYVPEAGLLQATCGMTWRTFRDDIAFRVESERDGEFAVTVTSRPSYMTLLDYGKNFQNIQAVTAALMRRGDFTIAA